MFLKFHKKISQENTCVGVSFFLFFVKFLRTLFLQSTSNGCFWIVWDRYGIWYMIWYDMRYGIWYGKEDIFLLNLVLFFVVVYKWMRKAMLLWIICFVCIRCVFLEFILPYIVTFSEVQKPMWKQRHLFFVFHNFFYNFWFIN